MEERLAQTGPRMEERLAKTWPCMEERPADADMLNAWRRESLIWRRGWRRHAQNDWPESAVHATHACMSTWPPKPHLSTWPSKPHLSAK